MNKPLERPAASTGCTGPCIDCALAQMGSALSPRPSRKVVATALRVFVLPLSLSLAGGVLLNTQPLWQPVGTAAGFWLGARLAALGKGGRWV